MQEAISKAAGLVEALGYIQRFHDKVIVVKVGGSIMDDEQALSQILTDIVFMNYVGMQPVLVHGGGKAINAAMEQAGLVPQMVQGRRYTDDRTLAIAEHVLCNQINKFIVNFIQSQGCEAMGLHSLTSVVLFAEKTYLSGPEGRRIDFGLVGEVKSVNARLLQLLVQADSIPCIATIARDDAGGKLNVNADTAAGAVAAAMKAEKLVVVSDTHGIRRDPKDPDTRVSHVTLEQIDEMVSDGVISSGMLPKVEACATALKGGVTKAHIIDGRIPHALLLEIYTEAGIGTEIVMQAGLAAKTPRAPRIKPMKTVDQVVGFEDPSNETDRLAYAVIGAAIEVHGQMGAGHLEAACERALCVELEMRGIKFERQVPFKLTFKGHEVGEGRIDLIVGGLLIVEIKACDILAPIHTAQAIAYLRDTGLQLALLINFSSPLVKDGIERVALTRK